MCLESEDNTIYAFKTMCYLEVTCKLELIYSNKFLSPEKKFKKF